MSVDPIRGSEKLSSGELPHISKPILPLPHDEVKGPQKLSTCGRFWAIPGSFFGDQQWMLFLVLFFGVATHTFTLAGTQTAQFAPYLGLASSPLYLVHAMKGTAANFKMLNEAGKTKRVSEGLFFLVLGLSSFGTALGDVIKPFSSGVQLAGLSHRGACALVFGRVIPIVMVAAGSISGLSAAAQMWRAQNELNKLRKKLHDPDFEKLAEVFNSIQMEHIDKLDEKRRIDLFVSDHPKRKQSIAKRLEGHSFTYACPLKDLKTPHDQLIPQEDKYDLLHKVRNLFHLILTDEVQIDDLRKIVNEIKGVLDAHPDYFIGEEIEAFREALQRQKEEIDKLEELSFDVLEEVKAELNRKIATQALMLFLAILGVTGGIIAMQSIPHHQLVGSMMVITGCIAAMANVLFDKHVSHEAYLKMDHFLRAKLRKIEKAVD
ncbi:MAG: hypothetical protein S4CHLAM81_13130 [Chlamydiales bacterium]|nr:hypothetical protein [Chlamydiales bacterium]MCH9636085.1 hypothetical protein [Chlamydiales bacterium]MCH9704370.1 hypothetical protein [Chlamydiota bacterium]